MQTGTVRLQRSAIQQKLFGRRNLDGQVVLRNDLQKKTYSVCGLQQREICPRSEINFFANAFLDCFAENDFVVPPWVTPRGVIEWPDFACHSKDLPDVH
jgi:hypothetical protein